MAQETPDGADDALAIDSDLKEHMRIVGHRAQSPGSCAKPEYAIFDPVSSRPPEPELALGDRG
jgi:hypothetical protein